MSVTTTLKSVHGRLSIMLIGLLGLQANAVGWQGPQEPVRDFRPTPGVSSQGVGYGAIALDDDWLMLSAVGFGSDDRPAFIEGAIRAFRRTDVGWELSQLVRPGELWDYQRFGRESIAIAGNVLVVGGSRYGLTTRPQLSGSAEGRLYVYSLVGGAWELAQTFEPRRFGGEPSVVPGIPGLKYGLGIIVETDGEQILSTAISQNWAGTGTMRGTVYSYTKDVNGIWNLDQLITAPPNSQITGLQDRFGACLALEEDLLAVGTSETFAEGVVLLYRRNASGWQFEHEFSLPFNDYIPAHWGRHIEIDQGRILISYVGGDTVPFNEAIWVYEQDALGDWVTTSQVRPSGSDLEPQDFPFFGHDFEIDGRWLLVGAPGANDGAVPSAGLAILYYDDPALGWTEVNRFRNFDQPASLPGGSLFGLRVAADFKSGVIAGTGPQYQECVPGNPYCTIGSTYMFDLEQGERFCNQSANSTGEASQLTVTGSLAVSENNFILHGYDMPVGEFALPLYGLEGTGFPVSTGGSLCLTGGGAIHRLLPAQVVGESGEIYRDLDLNAAALLLPGTTWGFQVWHRDQLGGASVTNMSNAVRVTLH